MSSPTGNINGTSSLNQDHHYTPSYTGQHENRTCTPAPPMARRTPDHVYNPQAVYHRGHLPGPTYADVVQGRSGNQVPDGYFPAPADTPKFWLDVYIVNCDIFTYRFVSRGL
ncbi:hypothetical protein F5877DRAFT_76328 [Lentinula edodes]|nr:hypothetical protein F5877DRAFT_76328 [Lentinula edodes]